MTRPTAEQVQQLIATAFPGDPVTVDDESHHHAGHAGAAGGAGHYRVNIVSARFNGLALPARHRLVYAPVAHLMPDRIHALAIEARATPGA